MPAAMGYEVVGNGQGGIADDIRSQGGANSIGREITVCAQPGQHVIGERVIQLGPGTAHRVIQNGPGIGEKIVVQTGNCVPAN